MHVRTKLIFSAGTKKQDSALLKEVRRFETDELKTAAPVKKNLTAVSVNSYIQ